MKDDRIMNLINLRINESFDIRFNIFEIIHRCRFLRIHLNEKLMKHST